MSNSFSRDRGRALRTIDQAAGQVRLKYITDIPGQVGVYLVKLEQAKDYLAAAALDAGAAVPRYVAAEARATGLSAAAAAQQIVTTGTLWNDELGPDIEEARIGGKKAVGAAESVEAVQTALAAALTALAGL